MKAAEVHDMKDDELVAKLLDAKQEAFNLRFRHATGELENTARLSVAKRDIAKLLTVARERGIDVGERAEDGYDGRRDEKTSEETTEGAAAEAAAEPEGSAGGGEASVLDPSDSTPPAEETSGLRGSGRCSRRVRCS